MSINVCLTRLSWSTSESTSRSSAPIERKREGRETSPETAAAEAEAEAAVDTEEGEGAWPDAAASEVRERNDCSERSCGEELLLELEESLPPPLLNEGGDEEGGEGEAAEADEEGSEGAFLPDAESRLIRAFSASAFFATSLEFLLRLSMCGAMSIYELSLFVLVVPVGRAHAL